MRLTYCYKLVTALWMSVVLLVTGGKAGVLYDGGEKLAENSQTEGADSAKTGVYPAQENLPEHVEYLFQGEFDTNAIGVATVNGFLYYDGTYDVSMGLWGFEAHVTWGTWDYVEGQFVFEDTDNNLHFASTSEGEAYFFTANFNGTEIPMTARMNGTKDASDFHKDPDSIPDHGGDGQEEEETKIPTSDTMLSDRYRAFSGGEWDELWEQKNFNVAGTYQARTYPNCGLDSRVQNQVPQEYFTPMKPEQRGTIEKLTYETYIYDFYESNQIPEEEWQTVEKSCYVYLPAGYSSEKQYNVYYLMHGAGGSEADWFSMNVDGTTEYLRGDLLAMVDFMIANGKMDPVIFVSATINTDVSALGTAISNRFAAGNAVAGFPKELKNDLIPAVESHYATYAKDTSLEGLRASRGHRAFGGLSLGAFVVWNSMAEAMDVMAYYAPLANSCVLGGNEKEAMTRLYGQMTGGEMAQYPLGFLFAGCGKKDHTWDGHMATVDAIYELAQGNLVCGENFYSFNPENGTHTGAYFILGCYNSLKVFFQEQNGNEGTQENIGVPELG